MMASGRTISIYLTEEHEKMIEDIRVKLIEVDRLRFGDKFVERELAKKKFSRYSNEAILKMLINAGYESLKRDLNMKYMDVKRESGKDINSNPIIKMIVEHETSRMRFNDIFRLF